MNVSELNVSEPEKKEAPPSTSAPSAPVVGSVPHVLVPRAVAAKWGERAWPELLAAAEAGEDGLRLATEDSAVEYALFREGWRAGLTVLYRQGW